MSTFEAFAIAFPSYCFAEWFEHYCVLEFDGCTWVRGLTFNHDGSIAREARKC